MLSAACRAAFAAWHFSPGVSFLLCPARRGEALLLMHLPEPFPSPTQDLGQTLLTPDSQQGIQGVTNHHTRRSTTNSVKTFRVAVLGLAVRGAAWAHFSRRAVPQEPGSQPVLESDTLSAIQQKPPLRAGWELLLSKG